LYAPFGSKDGSVEAYLRRRDWRWLDWFEAAVSHVGPGPDGVLAVFDALGEWMAEPDFNGCAFINIAGELAASPDGPVGRPRHEVALRALLLERRGSRRRRRPGRAGRAAHAARRGGDRDRPCRG
jgi:AcrR family transcriptional regulator